MVMKEKNHRNYYAGKMAEKIVAQKYIHCGFKILGRRVRKSEGEIDIIAMHKEKFYFIEVKKSKSFTTAAWRITHKQQQRIRNAALQFLADSGREYETSMRFDVALVDAMGRIKVIVNSF